MVLHPVKILVLVFVGINSMLPTSYAFQIQPVAEDENQARIPFWSVFGNFVRTSATANQLQDVHGDVNSVAQQEVLTSTSENDRSYVKVGPPEIPLKMENKMEDMIKNHANRSVPPDMRCQEVRRERFRCCRVYDNVVEAWWCPVRRPFCCHQGTSCAICCTIDELRHLEADTIAGGPGSGCQPLTAAPGQPPAAAAPVDDESWFWNGMKAAWLTMVGVLVASLCCTCIAHKCISYLVKIVNEEDPDLNDEYLAYHFDQLTLVGDDTATERQAAARRGPLPPKYSDINFTPVPPEASISVPAPSEPPPMYTSDLEPEVAAEAQSPPPANQA